MTSTWLSRRAYLPSNPGIMPATPWRIFGSPNPNGDFVALLSYLPLKSYWRVFPFVIHTAQVVKQLASADALLGYSLLARPLSKRSCTLVLKGGNGAPGHNSGLARWGSTHSSGHGQLTVTDSRKNEFHRSGGI